MPLSIWSIDVPTAPTLSLTDTGRDFCAVAWTSVTPPANSLITGYILYVDDGLDNEFKIAYDGPNYPSTFANQVTDLQPRRTYRLKVLAMNKAGHGAESQTITCYTVTIPG